MKAGIKFFGLVLSVVLSFSLLSCGNNDDHDSMHEQEMDQVHSPIIRDYSVNVASLDENKDGNVYQCPMDWEVISDETGSCPLCNMDLKEYSVADARQNLEEHRPHNH
ncbi:MAG TPA: heavy metal-binding domain-containing protein [Ignavibacteriaceae bacterium]|nr:heavy metal-binding domain-containing protein [Ignavibacteriaceae bacterium]